MKFKRYTLPVLIFTCIVIMAGCRSSLYHRCEGFVWGIMYHITYRGDAFLEDSIHRIFDSISGTLSIFDEGSVVSRLNNADSLEVNDMFIEVYKASKRIHEASQGMFDPTLSPLITAWGFGPGHKVLPDTAKVDSILNFVGLEKTRLNGHTLYKDDRRIEFNFSAIAKGYGCDEVARMLKRNGVSDFMVEIGGEITLGGKSPSGKDWKISIDVPDEKNASHEAFTLLSLTDCGIATSGNYRNYRRENGLIIGHTVSPLTGRPVISDILSATIIASNCMEADAIATACMAIGLQKSKEMLPSLGVEVLLIMADSTWATPGLSRMISEEVSEPGNINRD